MQVAAKEEPSMILSMTDHYYSSRSQFIKKQKVLGQTIHCYDVYDGKMLYGLTQHSLWSQKHHPFLLCKYRRGYAIRNYSTH